MSILTGIRDMIRGGRAPMPSRPSSRSAGARAGRDTGQARREPTRRQPTEAFRPEGRSQRPADRRAVAAQQVDPEDLLSGGVELLTAPAGKVDIKPSHRKLAALLSDGSLLISSGDFHDAHLSSEITGCARAAGVAVRTRLPVGIDVIAKLYEIAAIRAAKESGHVAAAADTVSELQRLAVRMIEDAAKVGATDIHISVSRSRGVVEMRIDGVLDLYRELPHDQAMDLCAAIYAMADSSDAQYAVTESQPGRISRNTNFLPPGIMAVRLQLSPLDQGGRYLVMRLLPAATAGETISLKDLGYDDQHARDLQVIRRKPQGIVIVAGPTGSGKSTTNYSLITESMREDRYHRNVITVEDPPEREIPRAKQIPITNAFDEEMRRAKFIEALSAAMREDPDVIYIGEIRDRPSAELAIKAAKTGHQVFTTLHANNALSCLDRLLDIGVEPYNLYDPTQIIGLVGQRLVRCLCPHCSIRLKDLGAEAAIERGLIDRDLYERLIEVADLALDDIRLRGPGCRHCPPEPARRGHRGRTVVAEVIRPDQRFMDICRGGDKAGAARYWTTTLGGRTMLQHGIWKMRHGIVAPDEVERVVDPLNEPGMT
jgi:type II secretory ATPase GspE/PulE/Tfp pilus assembly ATPase PilB-like protein